MPPTKARIITALALVAGGLLVLGASPAEAATEPGAFTGVDPARLLDTRNGIGAAKAAIQPGREVRLTIADRGGAPTAAEMSAVVLNVTVTGATRAGYVTAYPAGDPRPNASNLNFVAGQTIANHVTVKVRSGQVALYNGSTGPIQLIADLAGWYRTGTPGANGTFTPLTPTRLLDTRNAIGSAKSPLKANENRAFQVTGGQIPAGAGAAAVNLTATRPTRTGYLTAYPNGESRPNASNLNFVAGQTIPNAANAKIGSGGKVMLFNGSPGYTDAIADVAGWFRSGSTSAAGAYTPVTPLRVLDTRNNIGTSNLHVGAGESVTLTVAGKGGVPAAGASNGASAVVMNVTVTGTGSEGYVTAYPTASPRPGASNINFRSGQTVANLVTVKLGSAGKVNFYNGSSQDVDVIADLAGWYNAGPPPASFSSIANWDNWSVTLPVDADWKTSGTAVEIKNNGTPDFATFQDPAWFHMNDAADGVVFRANAGGATTSGSEYPRSELREWINNNRAAWSSTAGTHRMTITQAITHLPENKSQVVAGQIHDASSDVIEIRLQGTKLYAWRDGSATSQLLDDDYQLGTRFKVEVLAGPTGVTVTYWNPETAGAPTNSVTFPGLTGSGWYFKAGCYTQANTDTDDFTAYGEVVIYDLDVQHS